MIGLDGAPVGQVVGSAMHVRLNVQTVSEGSTADGGLDL
jgi:hypothetical protein